MVGKVSLPPLMALQFSIARVGIAKSNPSNHSSKVRIKSSLKSPIRDEYHWFVPTRFILCGEWKLLLAPNLMVMVPGFPTSLILWFARDSELAWLNMNGCWMRQSMNSSITQLYSCLSLLILLGGERPPFTYDYAKRTIRLRVFLSIFVTMRRRAGWKSLRRHVA